MSSRSSASVRSSLSNSAVNTCVRRSASSRSSSASSHGVHSLVQGEDPKAAATSRKQGNSSTTLNTEASLRTFRTRQVLSRQDGWEDAGLHDPWAMSSLHSSFTTVRSSYSSSWHNETTMSTGLGGEEAIAPTGLHRYATTPIVNAVPEGDKLSLRDIPFSEEVSAAIQQQKLKLKHEQEERGKSMSQLETKRIPSLSKMEISITEESTEELLDDELPPSVIQEKDITTHHNLMSTVTEETMLTEEYAMERLRFLFPDDSFGELPVDFPRFERNEIETGKRLGRGGFSDVDEIKQFLQSASDQSGSNVEALKRSRDFVHSRCLNRLGESRFALKQLRGDVKQDPARAWTGMVDLVVEARMLLAVQHPNILRLRAVAQGNPFQPDFFLILDRLHETLSKRLLKWKADKIAFKTKTPLLLRPFARKERKEKAAELWTMRLQSAYELTSALEHMHSHGVIHRDIKTDNIGFCLNNNVKLFDFGLARQIQSADEVYHLSMMTGSLRYMAPEVALGHPYNQKCDVYSFTVLLWEMLALKRPYDQYPNADALIQSVFEEDERPKLKRKWPTRIKETLLKGWHPDQFDRLTMAQLSTALRVELTEPLKGEDDSVPLPDPVRRRSTKIYTFSEVTEPVVSLNQDGFSAWLDEDSSESSNPQ